MARVGFGVTVPNAAAANSDIATAKGYINTASQIDVPSLVTAVGLTPQVITSMAQSAYSQFSADLQAQWDQQTSTLANDGRIASGAQAGADLISSGYNPDSSADNQKLIAVIAGAVSLIPAVGPILGAAIILLDAIGQAIGKFLQAVGLISMPGCRSTGNYTEKMVEGWYPRISQPIGSFASLAVPALMQNGADSLNCKAKFDHQVVLAGLATYWNAHASGPPMTIYVPAMGYAWAPFPFHEQAASAFQPANNINDVPSGNWVASTTDINGDIVPASYYGNTFSLQNPSEPSSSCSGSTGLSSPGCNPPFVLKLSGSYVSTASGGSPATSTGGPGLTIVPATTPTTSTATKVAVAAAAVPATVAIGTVVYAWAAGKSVDAVFGGLIRKVGGWVTAAIRDVRKL
jgi:hypothetical protein